MLCFALALAADLSLAVTEDTPASLDIPALTAVVKQGKRGTVVVASTRATYTPAKDSNGKDSFVVEVKGEGKPERVTVNVIIAAVNDLPVVEAMTLQPREDGSAGLPLTLRDVDSERFT